MTLHNMNNTSIEDYLEQQKQIKQNKIQIIHINNFLNIKQTSQKIEEKKITEYKEKNDDKLATTSMVSDASAVTQSTIF